MRHVRLALAAASQVFSPPVLRFVWLDLFCTSQHATFSRPPQWWQQVFSSAIATFGRVVMVMAPWDAPITLTRTWCIFELWACYSNRCRFEVALPASQRLKFLSDIDRDIGSFHDMLARVNSRSSTCSRDSDRQRIFDAVESSIGFTEMDRAVLETLEGWMLKQLAEQIAGASSALECARWKSALALLHDARGEFELKLSLAEDVYAIRLRELGADDVLTIKAHIELAVSLQDVGKVAMALPILSKSWEAMRCALGEDHEHTIDAALSLASCRFEAGLYEPAESMYKDCLARRSTLFGERARQTIDTKQRVASCLSLRGAYSDASAMLRECLDAARALFGAEHPVTMDIMDALAGVLLECGSLNEAEELLTSCLENSKRLLGAEHPNVRSCLILLCAVLCVPAGLNARCDAPASFRRSRPCQSWRTSGSKR
jgi:hypothetical protein